MAFEEARDFVRRFAEEIGVDPPPATEFEGILELAGVAAHASARQAAPVTCWLAAAAGLPVEEALDVARRVEDELGK